MPALRLPPSLRSYASAASAAAPAPAASLPALPALSEWRTLYNTRRKHIVLGNQLTGNLLVDAFFPSPDSSSTPPKAKVVIEAFAGAGVLTRSLLRLPKSRLHKLLALEQNAKFLRDVKELEAHDSRVHALHLNPHAWDTYDQIEAQFLAGDIVTRDNWKTESDLEFVAILPHSVPGEQLMAQLLRAIPERSWLFKHGRMRMNVIMPEQLFQRIDAPLGKNKRCKLSVIADATTRFRLAVPPAALRPYDDHFWPPAYNPRSSVPESRRPGHPMVAVIFEPLQKQIIQSGMLDKWDYILRRLFVLKSYTLEKALPSLAPGATNLLQYLTGPTAAPDARVNVSRRVNELTLRDWERIVRAFDKWPFAPDMLYIQNEFSDDRKSA